MYFNQYTQFLARVENRDNGITTRAGPVLQGLRVILSDFFRDNGLGKAQVFSAFEIYERDFIPALDS